MAKHLNSTPTPAVDLATPRQQAENAIYEVGIISDIIGKLATLMISSSENVCGTSFDWLATQLADRQQTLQGLIGDSSFGRWA